MFRLLLGSASMPRMEPDWLRTRYLITMLAMVVLPTPPFPASAIVVVIGLLLT